MGQSSPGSQTVTNKTEIDPTTQQWRNAIFGAGTNLYNQGAPSYYPGSTVTPYADQTWQGLDMLQANAQQGAVGLPQAYNAMGRAMGGMVPGMGTAMQASYGGMQNPWMGAEVAPQIANQIQLNSGANPYTGALAHAGQQETLPGAMPFVGAGVGANPYTGAISQAGQQGAAGSIQPWLNQTQQFLSSSPYAAQIAQTGEGPTTMGVGALESFAGAENPYLDQLYQQGAEKVRNDVNAVFSTAGRTGANAAHTGALTEGLGGLYANIYAPAYENAQNRRMQAAGQLAGIDQSDRAAQMAGYESAAGLGLQGAGMGLNMASLYGDVLSSDLGRNLAAQQAAGSLAEGGYGRALQAGSLYGDLAGSDANRALQGYGMAGDLAESGYGRGLTAADLYGGYLGSDIGRNAGLAETGFDRRLTGAGMAGDMWSQGNADAARAAAMLPGLYQYGAMPGESMVGIGGAYETLADQYLQDDIARYNYGQNANWDLLNRYSSLMTGIPDFSAQTQTTTGRPATNRAMGALGGASSGAAIGSMFMPGIGTGIGAGIGGLLGLFG